MIPQEADQTHIEYGFPVLAFGPSLTSLTSDLTLVWPAGFSKRVASGTQGKLPEGQTENLHVVTAGNDLPWYPGARFG